MFVRGERGGGGGERKGAYSILYEISSFFFALSSNFYRQLVQYKNTCTTVLSFSVSNDIFLIGHFYI